MCVIKIKLLYYYVFLFIKKVNKLLIMIKKYLIIKRTKKISVYIKINHCFFKHEIAYVVYKRRVSQFSFAQAGAVGLHIYPY